MTELVLTKASLRTNREKYLLLILCLNINLWMYRIKDLNGEKIGNFYGKKPLFTQL